MREKVMSGVIVPEKDICERCRRAAHSAILAGEEPVWFRTHYYGDDGVLEDLKSRCGLQVHVLATFALGFHFACETPKGRLPSDIKRRLKKERERLKKARAELVLLSNECRPESLKLRCTREHLADGSVVIDLGSLEDPYDNIIQAIDRFLEQSAQIEIQNGHPKSVLHHTVAAFVRSLEGREFSTPKLKELCHDLFDAVRDHHVEPGKDILEPYDSIFETMQRSCLTGGVAEKK
jgi:hypothetical protein